ncbi:MAG: glycine zipper domain-containing protein [Verrucomicrobiales bacterium]
MKYRKILHVVAGLLAVSMGSSCYSDSYGYAPAAKSGAVAGGLIGAGLGTIIGNQSHRPLEGAAIGGAIGALSGAALGSAQDDRSRYQPVYREPQRYNISLRYGRYPGHRQSHYQYYSGHSYHHSSYRHHPVPSCHVPFH